ncbi:MAG: RtcB family protein [Coriobacteriales bacterium]|nr:RtcB family protein [Coriobacteriales bacterium]
MFTIEGKCATAACYATQIEQAAIDQIKTMCDQEFTRGCNVAIMPDAHAGTGCTIGTTMQVKDAAVPNVVGVDIGCGMYTCDLGDIDLDMHDLDAACHHVPSGFSVWGGRLEKFDLTELVCFRSLKDTRRIERSLGTLGGGNHFIEVDVSQDGHKYLIIHSGSRNLGLQVANFYQDIAIELHSVGQEYYEARDQLIEQYKAEGRRGEIQAALKKLKATRSQTYKSDVPQELCWLYGTHLDDYLHDVAICQAFAKRSRELMAAVIAERLRLPEPKGFHTIHNYIDTSEKILRKGAIAAHEDELVLIPLNMRDGSILARGRGNASWNFSAPHGAGRIMSRAAAKQTLSLDDFKASMAGIYTTCVCEDTLDESPAAYKSIADILTPIAESVNIVEQLKPIYNFKATEVSPWKKK